MNTDSSNINRLNVNNTIDQKCGFSSGFYIPSVPVIKDNIVCVRGVASIALQWAAQIYMSRVIRLNLVVLAMICLCYPNTIFVAYRWLTSILLILLIAIIPLILSYIPVSSSGDFSSFKNSKIFACTLNRYEKQNENQSGEWGQQTESFWSSFIIFLNSKILF